MRIPRHSHPGSTGRAARTGTSRLLRTRSVAACASLALTLLAGAGWAQEPPPDLPDAAASAALPDASEPGVPYATDASVAPTTAAGRTPGFFGVTSSGAASYRIPIWTPPSVGSVKLDLALVYNSRSGNGVMGQGWSLAGLSVITRCNRTVAQDGAPAPVTNTLADRYCLDGQQLKLVGGVYGAPDSVYATEIESFSRIVASGTAGNGPASFTLTSKNGLVYEYGTTADSQVYAGSSSTIRTWALSRVRDRATTTGGNSIAIAYLNDARYGAYTTGSFRVSAITYPATATGQGPFYRIAFGYSARPASDAVVGYLVGSLVQEPSQLDAITVSSYSSGATIKSYNLSYAQGSASGRLRLRSVQECSATNCLAPTTIVYQQGERSWIATAALTGHKASARALLRALDLNGDGLSDLLYPDGIGNNVMSWKVAFAQAGGFGAAVDTGAVADAGVTMIPGRFLGNGRAQFLIPQGGYWMLFDYDGTSFQRASTGLVPGGEYLAADIDGDGLDDLVSRSSTSPVIVYARRNTTVPGPGIAQATFAPAAETIWSSASGQVAGGYPSWRVTDLNGDGRADLAIHTYVTTKRGGSWLTPLLSNGFGRPFTVGVRKDYWPNGPMVVGDWNADGCSDIIEISSVMVSNCAGNFASVATGATDYVVDTIGTPTILPADWDGDGRTDLLYVGSGGTFVGRNWRVVRSSGNGATAPTATGIAAPNNTAWFVLDGDGDGLEDLAWRDDDQNGRLNYHQHRAPGAPPDLATSFTDGFGMSQSPGYVSISRGNYTSHADAVFPEIDFRGPLYVVSAYSASNGAGGTYQNQFQYYGARVHLQGRGFEGFHSRRTYDSRNGTYAFDYLQRAFPYTGMQTQRAVLQSNLATRLSEWTATVSRQLLGAGAEQRVFPFVETVTDTRYEAGGVLDGELVTQASETYAYGDGYGNPTQVQRVVTDRDPGSPYSGMSWQSTTVASYANDATANCLGLPTLLVVTQSAPGQPAGTRTRSYAVDTGPCRITQQVLEPGSNSLKVTATFGFDGCGNVSSIGIVGSRPDGSPMPARTTSFGYGSRCQLPETLTNALGQTTSASYQYDFGVPLSLTDPNSLTTTWQYDDFGRRVLEARPDQTSTSWSYESCSAGPCWGQDDLRFREYETSKGAAAEVLDQREQFYDGFDRLRSNQYMRALGMWTTESYAYDALGRLATRQRPTSGASNGFWGWSYDVLDRVTAQKLYQPNGTADRATSFAYAGRSVRVTDPLGRTRIHVVDVAGRLRRVTDPAPGGTTSYDYDSSGNLVRVQDPIGAVSTGAYNARGFRTSWADADRGGWGFTGNSLNELVAWTDARGQSFSASYDALGRMTSRTDPDGTSTWNWGASAAAHNIGRLQSASGYGYGESLSYDGLGRLATRTITTDQPYQYDFAYGSGGVLDTLTYPASPVPAGQSGVRFKVRYTYSYGQPVQIADVTDAPVTTRALWTLNAANDDAAATSETLGANLLAVASDYKAWTGDLTSRRSGVLPATSNRQNLAYQWDAAGNLVQRQDLNQALTEVFAMDALDRVQSSTLNGAANFAASYDASGNIVARSDAGAYGYADPAHPHAVTAAGSHTYTYDASGNQITRDGASQAWASFNLPVQLAQPVGGATYVSRFSYGPDRQRWKQVASYSNGTETTLYAGGLLEKESATSTGRTYWRHYVRTPSGMTIVVSRNSDASTLTSYVLADHLGSSDAVLDAAGNVVARGSYGTFGARRASDWSSSTAPDWAGIANTTRHGYAGHEHLDNLALVHMNGRVYDPMTGRFLSVDPVMADLGDSQALNPYAYVGNRPLVSTDPDGLCVDGCIAEAAIVKFVASSILASAMNSIFGGSSSPPPPARALPGQSAQSDMPMCGPGQATPACGGWVLSAAGGPAGRGVPTSSWVNESDAVDTYADENLRQLFIDLGYNTIDVLILAPYYDAVDAVDAANGGHYAIAILGAGLVVCDVSTACKGAAAALKPLTRAGKQLRTAGRAARDATLGDVRVFRHYGYAEDASKFDGGLRPGSYATHGRGRPMTGAVAQERLALPHERPPNAYYKVRVGRDVQVVGPGRVSATSVPTRQGGGIEYVFPSGTPPGSVEGPFPIP